MIQEKKSAADLIIANKELAFQNTEKEKRAAELIVVNRELVFQNEEKEKRAAELIIANIELVFQNEEKEKRTVELILAYKELAFQNEEKEKRAAELIIANAELLYQNEEKEKRSIELDFAISELKKAEYSLRKLNEIDIRKLNEALEKKIIDRTEELEAVNQELESFSYSVSHDLRAPLRVVNGYALILQEEYNELFDDEGRRLLSIVQASAKRMGVLIDDLLAFSRLGKKELHKTNVSMQLLAENVVAELNRMMPNKAEIVINKLSPILADSALISQVLTNLLSNSIKYSAHSVKPCIEISGKKVKGDIVYSVSDNGVGFNMEYAHKLFEVFQRLHDADEFEGTGVGLALVHRILKKHGGKIWATSQVDKGSTFYFSLPNLPLNYHHGK